MFTPRLLFSLALYIGLNAVGICSIAPHFVPKNTKTWLTGAMQGPVLPAKLIVKSAQVDPRDAARAIYALPQPKVVNKSAKEFLYVPFMNGLTKKNQDARLRETSGKQFSWAGDTPLIKLPLEYLREVGITEDWIAPLQLFHPLEGNLEGIRIGDGGGISIGPIQMAGIPGTMARWLARVHHRSQALFYEYFGKFGLSVEYQLAGERLDSAKLSLQFINRKGELVAKYSNREVFAYLAEQPEFWGIWLTAVTSRELLVDYFIEANLGYVDPAKNLKVKLELGGKLEEVQVSNVLTSEKAKGILLFCVILRFVPPTAKMFQWALQTQIKSQGIRTKAEIWKIDEQAVLERLRDYPVFDSKSSQVKQRALKILNQQPPILVMPKSVSSGDSAVSGDKQTITYQLGTFDTTEEAQEELRKLGGNVEGELTVEVINRRPTLVNRASTQNPEKVRQDLEAYLKQNNFMWAHVVIIRQQ
jgi:hypothetical protein